MRNRFIISLITTIIWLLIVKTLGYILPPEYNNPGSHIFWIACVFSLLTIEPIYRALAAVAKKHNRLKNV